MLKKIILIIFVTFFNTTVFAGCEGQCKVCYNECEQDNFSWVNQEGKKYVNKEEGLKYWYLQSLCNARCTQQGCTAKPVAEYLTERATEANMPVCRNENGKAERKAKTDKEMEGLRNARREYEASKRNYENAVRNPPPPQARTQTSQNNYPSDNTYEQSGTNQVSSGEEYVAHNCIVTNSKGGFKNICSYEVNFSYCLMNSQPLDPNVRMGDANTKCERNSLGSSSLYAGRESSGLYTGQWYWFACRSPAAVTNARFVSGGVSAYCKKY